jgi:hypothetical protein
MTYARCLGFAVVRETPSQKFSYTADVNLGKQSLSKEIWGYALTPPGPLVDLVLCDVEEYDNEGYYIPIGDR